MAVAPGLSPAPVSPLPNVWISRIRLSSGHLARLGIVRKRLAKPFWRPSRPWASRRRTRLPVGLPPPDRLSPAGACSSPTGFPVLLSSSMRADITAETVGASVVLSIGGFPRVSFRIARVCSMLGPHVCQTAFAARFRVLQSTLLPPALAAASIAAESDTDAVHDYNGRTSAILHRARLPTARRRPDFCSGFHASFSSTSRRRSGVILRGRREAALRRSVASWRACAVAAPAYMPIRSSRGGGRAAARSRLSIRRCASRYRSDYASVR